VVGPDTLNMCIAPLPHMILFRRRAPGDGGLPLLARLTRDVPEQNQYFFSALASFATRTAYANTCKKGHGLQFSTCTHAQQTSSLSISLLTVLPQTSNCRVSRVYVMSSADMNKLPTCPSNLPLVPVCPPNLCAGQDHLVGWSNSSLRFMHQLPLLPASAATAKGVVLEDPLLAAFDVRWAECLSSQLDQHRLISN
jgi:hypothetical protein